MTRTILYVLFSFFQITVKRPTFGLAFGSALLIDHYKSVHLPITFLLLFQFLALQLLDQLQDQERNKIILTEMIILFSYLF